MHGVVVSHPLRMRKALGSILSASISEFVAFYIAFSDVRNAHEVAHMHRTLWCCATRGFDSGKGRMGVASAAVRSGSELSLSRCNCVSAVMCVVVCVYAFVSSDARLVCTSMSP